MRDGRQTRERIERAALRLFVQGGVAETSALLEERFGAEVRFAGKAEEQSETLADGAAEPVGFYETA